MSNGAVGVRFACCFAELPGRTYPFENFIQLSHVNQSTFRPKQQPNLENRFSSIQHAENYYPRLPSMLFLPTLYSGLTISSLIGS